MSDLEQRLRDWKTADDEHDALLTETADTIHSLRELDGANLRRVMESVVEMDDLRARLSRYEEALRNLLEMVESDRYGTDFPLHEVDATIGRALAALDDSEQKP